MAETRMSDRDHRMTAAWVFGTALLVLLSVLLFIGPETIPTYRLAILIFLMAICAGVFAALMTGRIVTRVRGGRSMGAQSVQQGKEPLALVVTAVGGLGVFVFVCVFFSWITGLLSRPGSLTSPPGTPSSLPTTSATNQVNIVPTKLRPLVTVDVGRIPDEESRASANFSVPSSNAKHIRWQISGAGPYGDAIRFGISIDRAFAADVNLIDDIADGMETPNVFQTQRDALYICRVRSTRGNSDSVWTACPKGFKVTAYAVE